MRSFAKRSALIGMVVALGLLAISREAQAGSIIDLGAAGCTGQVCAPLIYPDGTLSLTAQGGVFAIKSRNGATGLGVRGRTRGEIDVDEFINGVFSSATTLDAFTVLFLFNGAEFGDSRESARISINGGSIVGMLTADAENSAVWSLGGATVTSCGDTSSTGTGCFRISNPFGATSISDISFTAVSVGTVPNDSDYSLGSLELTTATATATAAATVAVPEPASLMLLASGALGLAARQRRRRQRA